QGAGAISAAVMALLSDLTREQHRTKAMAMIGMSIGLSFAAAMVIGPLLTRAFGLSGLFWATAGLALLGILLVAALVPKAPQVLQHRESVVARQALGATLRHSDLLRLDFGIGALHAILMATSISASSTFAPRRSSSLRTLSSRVRLTPVTGFWTFGVVVGAGCSSSRSSRLTFIFMIPS
ncbi:MFS transporter, partial [Azotobacter chroococcum]|nr:MFS transporter [Azotobacter chroococcum]